MCIIRIFIFFFILFGILISGCGRSDLIRIRLLAPVSESNKDYTVFKDVSISSSEKIITFEEPKTSGANLYFLLKSFGVGYSKISTKIKKNVIKSSDSSSVFSEETTLDTNFADVVFGIGENYTFMWGAGIPIGGNLKSQMNYGYPSVSNETVESETISGHSAFFVFGHHGYGFETLLGFRTNFIKVALNDTLSSAKTLKYSSKLSK